MNNWNNIMDYAGNIRAQKTELKNLERWQLDTADAQQWTLPDPYIFANQADMYRLDPNLGAVLDMFAEDIGMAAFSVMRRKNDERIDMPNHEFELLMESPNPLDTGLELVAQTVTDYKLNGNAIWWLNRKSYYDKPTEMWYIPFSQIQPVPDGRLYLSHYEYFPGNGKQSIPIPTWQIVHFKSRNPFHRFIGLSPIESLADTLVGDIGMRKTQRTTFVQYNGEPPSILAFKDYIPDDAWEEIKNKVEQSARENKMLKLRGAGEAVSWMSRAMSNKDMDVVALYRQNREDIWNRIVPGAYAMLDTSANRSTADAARATYSESLWRMMQVLAKKITKEILYVYTWGDKLVGEFDDPRIVDRQIELAEVQEFAKYHTLEEVRKQKFNADPLGDERDKLLVAQVNSATGDGTKKPVQAQPFTEQPENETMDEQEEEIDASTKAAIGDLRIWRRMALRGKDKAREFTSTHISPATMKTIKAQIRGADAGRIAQVFDGEIARLQPKVTGAEVLKGIELAVRAMEAK